MLLLLTPRRGFENCLDTQSGRLEDSGCGLKGHGGYRPQQEEGVEPDRKEKACESRHSSRKDGSPTLCIDHPVEKPSGQVHDSTTTKLKSAPIRGRRSVRCKKPEA